MGSVPWQVGFGQWIGWTSAAALVAVGCVLLWLWVRWVAKRQGAAATLAFGKAETKIHEGPIVLRGRLEVPGAPVPSLDGSGAAAACTAEGSSETLRFAPHQSGAKTCFRAPSLRVKTPDGELTLRGCVYVTHGSREAFPGRMSSLDDDDRERLRSTPDDVVAFGNEKWPKGLDLPGVVRTVRHGNDVILRGLVRRNMGDGGPGASYRPMDSAFEVVAPEGKEAIEIAASAPGTVAFSATHLLARGLVVGLTLSLLVGAVVGTTALRVNDYATAALFPPQRARAIASLAAQVQAGAPSETKLATVLAYEPYAPSCQRRGKALLRHGRWKQAGDVLARCNDAHSKARAAEAYRMAGALTQACKVPRSASPDDAAHGTSEQSPNDALNGVLYDVLGGCEQRASAALRRGGPPPHEGSLSTSTRQCLADALAARSGDARAKKRLDAADSEACRLARADLLEGTARVKALAFLADAPASERKSYRHALLRTVLSADAGGPIGVVPLPHFPTASELIQAPNRVASGRAHALEQHVLDTLTKIETPTPEQRALRRTLAIRAAAFAIISGADGGVPALLDLAQADVAALRSSHSDSISARDVRVEGLRAEAQIVTLRVVEALLRGGVTEATAALSRFHDLTPSRFLDDLPPSDALPTALTVVRREVVRPIQDAEAVIAAARGTTSHGKHVGLGTTAALLGPPSLFAHSQGDAPAHEHLLPLLVPGASDRLPLLLLVGRRFEQKPAMLRWLRYDARTSETSPTMTMWHATLASHAARMLGDSALADRTLRVAHAYRQAMLKRPAAMILALLPSSRPTWMTE